MPRNIPPNQKHTKLDTLGCLEHSKPPNHMPYKIAQDSLGLIPTLMALRTKIEIEASIKFISVLVVHQLNSFKIKLQE